jgi:hypothetical protein
MSSLSKDRRIIWIHVLTVVSAAILIGAEVFGAAFAAGWAFANLFGLGEYGVHILQAMFFVLGVGVMTVVPILKDGRDAGVARMQLPLRARNEATHLRIDNCATPKLCLP